MASRNFDYDVLVVGSGFGGSVTALRLTEKGYRVGVLESGRRFAKGDFPKSNWNARKFLWAPAAGMRGIQRLTLLRDVLILSGAGVGGGSLVYANTLYEPLDHFWSDPQWGHLTDWKAELGPHYDTARRMLGVNETPFDTPADDVMRAVADRMGVADTFHHTPVGVYFGKPGETVADPYFGGEGPDRTGCIRCGGCMVGCNHGAKNTLDRNYLYLAEKRGADVHPNSQVVDLIPRDGGGYEVHVEKPGAWLRRDRRIFTAEQVVLSAGVLGTLRLLSSLKAAGRLPGVSDKLGDTVRTNSEAILGAQAGDHTIDYSPGVAITSSIHPDERTHIEPCRYPPGSNAMGLLATVLVDGGGKMPRQLRFVASVLKDPKTFLQSMSVRRWSEKTVILLVMQSHDNSIRVRMNERRRKRLAGAADSAAGAAQIDAPARGIRLTSSQGHGEPNPTYIPVANEAARYAAEAMGGAPGSAINEVLLDTPTTAHILGGCCIGATPDDGVIDPYQRVFGCPGLHVADGSAISANLGVNPSLTITAMTERAMSLWPNAGEADQRPELGETYRRIDRIKPAAPAVPSDAPAALRF